MSEPIVGHFCWVRGRKGFAAEKRPVDYRPPKDDAPPVAMYPLGAAEFALSILILEQRYPPPRPPEESAPPPSPESPSPPTSTARTREDVNA